MIFPHLLEFVQNQQLHVVVALLDEQAAPQLDGRVDCLRVAGEGDERGGDVEIEPEPAAAARCSNTAPPSAGFKLALGGLAPKLRKALDDNAAAGPFGPPPFG